MIQINLDSIEVCAKLNYLRDKAFDLIDESWESVKDGYIEEANFTKDMYVWTVEEVDAIMENMV